MKKVYRSQRLRGLVIISVSALIALFGIGGIAEYSGVFFFWMCFVAGLVGIGGGISDMSIRVTIDDHGLVKSVLNRVVLVISWDEVTTWCVAPVTPPDDRQDDSFTFRKIEFYLRNQERATIVYDTFVWRPGFDKFLEDLRSVLAIKENQMTPR